MNKRSKACDISKKVRENVYDRDYHLCVICGKYVPISCANAHFVKRSQGGLGIEENIVTLCVSCHYEEDHGKNTKKYEKNIEQYLKNIYGNTWSKNKLYYKKY